MPGFHQPKPIWSVSWLDIIHTFCDTFCPPYLAQFLERLFSLIISVHLAFSTHRVNVSIDLKYERFTLHPYKYFSSVWIYPDVSGILLNSSQVLCNCFFEKTLWTYIVRYSLLQFLPTDSTWSSFSSLISRK